MSGGSQKAGADIVTVHYEACGETLKSTLELIRAAGAKCGAVINPDTPAEKIADVLPLCDMVLVMSVFPGFGGQKFIGETLENVRFLRNFAAEHGLSYDIEIDGGITPENAGPRAGGGGKRAGGGQRRVQGARSPRRHLGAQREISPGFLKKGNFELSGKTKFFGGRLRERAGAWLRRRKRKGRAEQ